MVHRHLTAIVADVPTASGYGRASGFTLVEYTPWIDKSTAVLKRIYV
jgi:hypothetical protein